MKNTHKKPASTLWVSAPSAKRYDSGRGYRNDPLDFPAVSITGTRCALSCAHCQGQLLEHMIDASGSDFLKNLGPKLAAHGSIGVLVSGGANRKGQVPLTTRLGDIKVLKDAGLKVVVHTGLIDQNLARGLKEVGVDQVLFDLVADQKVISDVYHLPYSPSVYFDTLEMLCREGLNVVPHVVAGLNFGTITGGEMRAIEVAADLPVSGIVLVVLVPLSGTVMEKVGTPKAEEVGSLLQLARQEFTERTVLLGCARPANAERRTLERLAVDSRVDGIAFAAPETLDYAEEVGYEVRFFPGCCSLVALERSS